MAGLDRNVIEYSAPTPRLEGISDATEYQGVKRNALPYTPERRQPCLAGW